MTALQKCLDCGFRWSLESDDGYRFDTCPSCESRDIEREEEAMKETIQVQGSNGWRTLCTVQDPSEMVLTATGATQTGSDLLHALRTTYPECRFRATREDDE